MQVHTAVFLGTLLVAPSTTFAQAPADSPQQAPAAPAPATGSAQMRGVSAYWLDLERIVQASAEGKIANAKVQALQTKKSSEISEKTKQLQASQQKLQAGGTVLNDSARNQLEREIDRLNVDIQRMQQDAQQELQELQVELQAEFQKKLMPVIEKLVKERNINILFSRVEAGIVFADPTLDLTDEVIKRFDASSAVAPPAAPKPSAPASKPPAAIPPSSPPPGSPPGR